MPVLPVIAVVGGLGYLFAKTDEAMQLDASARKKLTRAYTQQVEAQELVEAKKAAADNALTKVINRKKAVLNSTMTKFLTLYKQIIKINFLPGDGIKELTALTLPQVEVQSLQNMHVLAGRQLSDQELVKDFLVSGVTGVAVVGAGNFLTGAALGPIGVAVGVAGALGGSFVEDSRRNLSNAGKQLKASNVVYAQAENLGTILDLITERCTRLAALLAKMNVLFQESINYTAQIVTKNGTNRQAYSETDRIAIKTCINWADAVKKLLDVPMFDQEGLLTEETEKALAIGAQFVKQVQKLG